MVVLSAALYSQMRYSKFQMNEISKICWRGQGQCAIPQKKIITDALTWLAPNHCHQLSLFELIDERYLLLGQGNKLASRSISLAELRVYFQEHYG